MIDPFDTTLRDAVKAIRNADERPHGVEVDPANAQLVGAACVALSDGDADVARTRWRLIAEQCGGYMPMAAGYALIVAANPNVVPDVTAPDPT